MSFQIYFYPFLFYFTSPKPFNHDFTIILIAYPKIDTGEIQRTVVLAITNKELLEINCDILIPANAQSVITNGNANKIKAKLIIEEANGPITAGAEKILEDKGVTIIPDVLVNCGSAIVCSFEHTQGLTDTYWDNYC